MEVPNGRSNKGTVLLYEFLGTAILLIGINQTSHTPFAPFGVGMTLFTCICVFGNVSGGHFNPAVTLGVLVKEGAGDFGRNIPFALMIIVAEFLGAILGVFTIFLLNKKVTNESMVPGVALLCPEKQLLVSTLPCDGTGVYF